MLAATDLLSMFSGDLSSACGIKDVGQILGFEPFIVVLHRDTS